MRLTDTCTLSLSGSPYGPSSWRCEFGHTGGERPAQGGVNRFTETARVILQPSEHLARLPSPAGLTVTHKGKTYTVTAILPRYRTRGRLHHVSLDLSEVVG